MTKETMDGFIEVWFHKIEYMVVTDAQIKEYRPFIQDLVVNLVRALEEDKE